MELQYYNSSIIWVNKTAIIIMWSFFLDKILSCFTEILLKHSRKKIFIKQNLKSSNQQPDLKQNLIKIHWY